MGVDRPYRYGQEKNRKSVQYRVAGPFLNRSMQAGSVQEGSFYTLSGVDPRFVGGLRKWFGMKAVKNIADTGLVEEILGGTTLRKFRYVTFRKYGTGTMYSGFVVLVEGSGSTAAVSLVYTADGGSTWAELAIHAAGGTIAETENLDVMVADDKLFVFVTGESTKLVYYNGSALVCVDAGSGVFADGTTSPLPAMTVGATSVDTAYNLNGSGVYEVRYRFYSAVRGIYSAMSDRVVLRIDQKDTAYATNSITFTAVPADGDQVVITNGDSLTRVYEFQSIPPPPGLPPDIVITTEATAALNAAALVTAINADTGNTLCTAELVGNMVLLTAQATGTAGNKYGLSLTVGISNYSLTLQFPFEESLLPNSAHVEVFDGSDSDQTGHWYMFYDDAAWAALSIAAWAAGSTYTRNEVVTHGGKYFVCKKNVTVAGTYEPEVASGWAEYWAIGVRVDTQGDASGTDNAIAFEAAVTGNADAEVTATVIDDVVTLTSKISGTAGAYFVRAEDSRIYVNGQSGTVLARLSGTGGTAFGTVRSAIFSGGSDLALSSQTVKAVMNFPNDTSFGTGKKFANFSALFDKVEVFRSINLVDVGTEGAILYLEQTLDMPANSGAWDALTVNLGTMMDEALPFAEQYDPETDVVKAIPSGTEVGEYYQETTFIGGVGVDEHSIFHSNTEAESPEYFTTYNERKGSAELGTVMKMVKAGDSLFIFCTGGILHIFKSGKQKPIQYTELHAKKGLLSRGAAHSVGSSVAFIAGGGLYLMNSSDGTIGRISTVDRIIIERWIKCIRNDGAYIESGYDSDMDCSFFLLAGRSSLTSEMIVLCHSTQAITMLEQVPFVHMDYGLDIVNRNRTVCYFVTGYGRVVECDIHYLNEELGTLVTGHYGNMGGIDDSTYLMKGACAATSSATSIVVSAGAFHADMKGHYLTLTSGTYAGISRMITNVTGSPLRTLTIDTLGGAPAVGDTFVVAAIPFRARFWKPNASAGEQIDDFRRYVVSAIAVKVGMKIGFATGDYATYAVDGVDKYGCFRAGIVRNGVVPGWSSMVDVPLDTNPSDAVAGLSADGVDVEPYLEQWSEGTMFELTGLELQATMTSSRHVM